MTYVQGIYILIEYADLRPLGITIVKSNLNDSLELDFVQGVKGKRPSWLVNMVLY
jgi:hypothetical protein